MFKKLKRKFVIINMALLTSVFIIIFLVIYFLTAATNERQLAFDMQRLMDMPLRPLPTDRRLASSMIVIIDDTNQITRVYSFMTIEEEIIEEAVGEVLAAGENRGNISAGGVNYAYLRREIPQGTKIVFVDREPLQENLMNLLRVFLLTGAISLILLFLISLQLANRTIKPIKEAFEKQQQFIADASHELKTPLTIIKTNLAVIKANETETVRSQAKWLGFIHSQTERMTNLVNDLLTLAKVDSVEMGLVFAEFNLTRVIEGILLLFEAALFENEIQLEKELQPGILFHGDKEGFQRVMNILLDNAIKNTPRNGVIAVSLAKGKSSIKIVVKNTGPGIPKEQLERIFERFYRGDDSRARKSGGYGLGLAIAKSIVEHHQGKIYAKSRVGVATSFIIELPVDKTGKSINLI